MTGRTIRHYRILERLEDSPGGAAFHAVDTRLERPVVLRLAAEGVRVGAPEGIALYERARVAAALRHPTISKIHEIGEFEGRPFVARSWEEGETLAERLETGASATPEQTLRWARELAEGLEEAHRRGVVHGHLRPENVLITPEGRAKILNFELEAPEGVDLYAPDALRCLSPERCAGAPPDPAADLWALGVILYEALRGRPPFSGEYGAALLYAINTEELEPIPEPASDLAAELDRSIRRALTKDPERRYPSATAWLTDLRRLDERLRGPVRRLTTGQILPTLRGLERRRRLSGPALAATAVVVAALLTVVIFLSLAGPGDARRGVSLAVLPLTDLSLSPGDEYFAEGMTEELITALARIGALRVTSRTSVMGYRDSPASSRDVAQRLGVQYIVEGSVLRNENRVRVNAKLINAEENRSIWASSYEYPLQDVLALQSQVARAIASEIEVQVTPEEQLRLARSQTVQARTYEAFLRGRYLLNRREQSALVQARDLFLRLTQEDPRFAQAHAGLADAYILLANTGFAPPTELWPKAREAALRAVQLDPDLAEAYSSLALIASFYDWDWDEAVERYQEARELSPSNAVVRQRYGVLLSRLGRHDEAIDEIRSAAEIDPLDSTIRHSLGVAYFMARQYDEAAEQFLENIRSSTDNYRAHWYLGRSYLEMNRCPKGLEELERARQLSDDNAFMTAFLAYGAARCGDRERADRLLGGIQGSGGEDYLSPASLAVVYIGMELREQALIALERALEARSSILVWLKVDPLFDPLRQEPRFQELLRAVRLS